MQALKGDKEKEEDYMTREAWIEEGEQRGERKERQSLLVNAFLFLDKHTESKSYTIERMNSMLGIPKDEIVAVLVNGGVLSDGDALG